MRIEFDAELTPADIGEFQKAYRRNLKTLARPVRPSIGTMFVMMVLLLATMWAVEELPALLLPDESLLPAPPPFQTHRTVDAVLLRMLVAGMAMFVMLAAIWVWVRYSKWLVEYTFRMNAQVAERHHIELTDEQ